MAGSMKPYGKQSIRVPLLWLLFAVSPPAAATPGAITATWPLDENLTGALDGEINRLESSASERFATAYDDGGLQRLITPNPVGRVRSATGEGVSKDAVGAILASVDDDATFIETRTSIVERLTTRFELIPSGRLKVTTSLMTTAQNPDWRRKVEFSALLGIGAGFHAADRTATFTGAVGGTPPDTVTIGDDAPTQPPDFWLHGSYVFTPKISADVRFGWQRLDSGKFDGRIFSLSASVVYRFEDNWGVGVGLQYIDTDLTVGQAGSRDEFGFGDYGPSVFLTVGF